MMIANNMTHYVLKKLPAIIGSIGAVFTPQSQGEGQGMEGLLLGIGLEVELASSGYGYD